MSKYVGKNKCYTFYAVSQQTYIDQHLNIDISLIDLVGGLLSDQSIILSHLGWEETEKSLPCRQSISVQPADSIY